MAAGGNNFNDFADSQLAIFRAVFHQDGCCKQWAVMISDNDARRFARVTKHYYSRRYGEKTSF